MFYTFIVENIKNTKKYKALKSLITPPLRKKKSTFSLAPFPYIYTHTYF